MLDSWKSWIFFFAINNGLSKVGNKIDLFFERWRGRWRNLESIHIFPSIVICCIFLTWICIPYRTEGADANLLSGQILYLRAENKLTDWLEKHNLYGKQVDEKEFELELHW